MNCERHARTQACAPTSPGCPTNVGRSPRPQGLPPWPTHQLHQHCQVDHLPISPTHPPTTNPPRPIQVYMEPQHSAEVVRWLGSRLRVAAMAIYEQVRGALGPLVQSSAPLQQLGQCFRGVALATPLAAPPAAREHSLCLLPGGMRLLACMFYCYACCDQQTWRSSCGMKACPPTHIHVPTCPPTHCVPTNPVKRLQTQKHSRSLPPPSAAGCRYGRTTRLASRCSTTSSAGAARSKASMGRQVGRRRELHARPGTGGMLFWHAQPKSSCHAWHLPEPPPQISRGSS